MNGVKCLVNRSRWLPFVFLFPALLFLLFVYIPILQNIVLSFFQWSTFEPQKAFIGFGNYIQLFQDPVFFQALKNNALYAAVSIVFQVGGGLITAAILEDRLLRRSSPFFRTVFFLPVVISMTVIALLFDFIYNPDTGLLNQFLQAVGLESVDESLAR